MSTNNMDNVASEPGTSAPRMEVFDVAIDLQYARAPIEAEQYAREPWIYYSNAVSAYLSSRQGKLLRFKTEMGKKDAAAWKRVEHEIERIEALRERFRGNKLKRALMEELDECRRKLRAELWKDTTERKIEVEKRLPGPNNRKPREDQLAVLQRLVGKEPPIQAEEGDEGYRREALDGFKAGVMHFKKEESGNSWKGFSPSNYDASYPNQKLTMRKILAPGDDNPLSANGSDEEELRYFHFPANNMEWIEKAMTILYGDDKAGAEKILAREFWRAPFQPRPEKTLNFVSETSTKSNTGNAPYQNKNGGKNIAIFLPYLHWETSSRRARMVEIVDEVIRPKGQKKNKRKDVADVVKDRKKSDHKKKRCYRHYIGDYLMAVAKVAEEMDYEDDEHLLRDSISAKAPLHRPEVMDLFASAIGHVTEQTAVAYESFWRNLSIESHITPSVDGNFSHHKRLDINPEGIILQEAQDIAEELRIMGRVFADQWKVTKDLKRHLTHPEGEYTDQVQHGLSNHRGSFGSQGSPPMSANIQVVHEVAVLVEDIGDRQAEIKDLEDSALRACQQLEKLLSLKQQQASIVEAKAALRRADESVKQGRAIMAFTLVTIFFVNTSFD
ncbi:hypothetical protein ONZ43_g6374 [Nemania bipapillata]|uniref:Uncharacterized protein n=1 Tax=Nemania bipapillata TaxID=110536 RepID=A0ACC2I1G4_9PEZI|nr:hypothetical protein ONZ43_g6374 [Nemania bipapillata]